MEQKLMVWLGVALIVMLLVLRQLMRRQKGRKSKAAEPDPQSRLDLHS